jgi:hypothetical protein
MSFPYIFAAQISDVRYRVHRIDKICRADREPNPTPSQYESVPGGFEIGGHRLQELGLAGLWFGCPLSAIGDLWEVTVLQWIQSAKTTRA